MVPKVSYSAPNGKVVSDLSFIDCLCYSFVNRLRNTGTSYAIDPGGSTKTIKLLSLDDTNLASPSKILKLREKGPVYPYVQRYEKS